jgi:hypothetical protein
MGLLDTTDHIGEFINAIAGTKGCVGRNREYVLRRLWQKWLDARRQAHDDADKLIEQYGPVAYEVAWTMSRDVRSGELIDQTPDGHWDRVLALVARRTGGR